MTQERARHFGEGALDQVQPGAVFRGMHVFEAPRPRRQIRHGLAGDVGGVIVEDDANDGVGRIVAMQALQQRDELAAAMVRLDLGDDFAGVQIQRGENRQRAVAHVLMVARQHRLLPRHRRQVRGSGADSLYARLLVHGHRVGGRRGIGARRRQEHVAIDHQDFPHLAVELRVATFQIVAHPMRLQILLLQDAPDAAPADA